LTSSAAFSQRKKANQDTGLREVQGKVTSSSGQTVDKAVVQLKNTKSLQIASFITDSSGRYHFAGLSTDVEYQLKADAQEMTSGWKTLSLFNSKRVVTINLKLSKRKRT
jgi:Carboxypeptidase regulatory-like domain